AHAEGALPAHGSAPVTGRLRDRPTADGRTTRPTAPTGRRCAPRPHCPPPAPPTRPARTAPACTSPASPVHQGRTPRPASEGTRPNQSPATPAAGCTTP